MYPCGPQPVRLLLSKSVMISVHNIIIDGKGRLTGCGPHAYSFLSFHFLTVQSCLGTGYGHLTSQSNVVISF